MTRAELLAVLADGEPRLLPKGPVEVLVASGIAEWVNASTFSEGIEFKRTRQKPVRLTQRGLEMARLIGVPCEPLG